MTKDEIKYLVLNSLGYVEQPDFVQSDDNAVKAVNAQYEHYLSLCISMNKWNFFTTQVELTREDNTGKFKNKYELPTDVEMINNVYTDAKYTRTMPKYEMYGGYIYSDFDKCFIDYRRKVCEGALAPYFIEFLRLYMAYGLCQNVTGDKDLEQSLLAKANYAFEQAKALDNLQKPVKILDSGVFADVRNF